MTDYEALLGELETMAKAMPGADAGADARIAEAAGEPPEGEEAEGEGEDADGKPMAKSFKVTVDGEEREAVDADDLIKSLQAGFTADAAAREARIVKALGQAVGLIKSMGARIDDLASTAKPRKSVLAIADKPAGSTLAKADSSALSPAEFMAKAEAMHAAGKVSLRTVSIAEQYLNSGQSMPAEIIHAVLGA